MSGHRQDMNTIQATKYQSHPSPSRYKTAISLQITAVVLFYSYLHTERFHKTPIKQLSLLSDSK